MPDVTFPAVLVATIVAFVLGSTYYVVFGEQLAEVSDAAATGERAAARSAALEADQLRSLGST